MTLLDDYRNATATDQAHLILSIMDAGEDRGPEPLHARGPAVDPDKPRCPACRQPIAEVNAINFSAHNTEAELDGVELHDRCAEISDFHVTHYLTLCCAEAVSFDARFSIDYT
jgi:hypothetical protein